jgi:hypothetical protein
LISFYVVKNDRTALTIVPFLAMLAGLALDAGLGWIGKQWEHLGRSPTSLRVLSAGLILVALALPAVRAVQINRRFMQEDVRTQVTRWLQENLEPGTRVVGEYYSPLLVNSGLEFRWIDYASDQPYEWYLAHADYVVLMENRYQGFFVDPSRYPEQVALYAQLCADSNLVKEFDGVGLGNAVRAQIYRVQQ